MKALRFNSLGSMDALALDEVPLPERQDGDVLVEIRAAGINPSDAKNVLGKFPYTTLPRTPGRDFSGIVVDGPQNLKGGEVWGSGSELGFTRDGSHAEYLAVRADGVAVKPESLTFSEAAACGVPFVTAWSALERTEVKEGSNVLVVGAAGAVGKAAVELARARGANVVGAVRREEQSAALRERGVTPLLLNAPESLTAEVGKVFPDGAGVVFDTTGFWLAPAVAALAKYGRLAVIVAPGDGNVNVPVRMLYRRGGSIIGVDSMLHDSRLCAGILKQIASLFDAGKISPPDGLNEIPIGKAVQAYHEIEAGSHLKTVIVQG